MRLVFVLSAKAYLQPFVREVLYGESSLAEDGSAQQEQ